MAAVAADEVLVSVRGGAEELVEPDRLTVHGRITRAGASKGEALGDLGAGVERLVAALRAASAVPRTAATGSAPWTWSIGATTTAAEHDTDPTGRMRLTGGTAATVTVTSTLTDLGQLEALVSVLEAQEGLHVQSAAWSVDPANPAWERVRAAAIAAAVRKARDYATALGGEIARLEHVADAGLLGQGGATVSYSGSYLAAGDVRTSGPPLDPEPQSVAAQVEARFAARGISVG